MRAHCEPDLYQHSAFYPNSESFGWEVISFAPQNLDFDHSLSSIQLVWSQSHISGTLVLFHWPLSLSEAILGFLTMLVVSGCLNLRSYTTSFLPHSLDQNKLQDQTQIHGEGA